VNAFALTKGQRDLTKLVAFLSALSAAKAWRVEITELRLTRSIQQCRYLNGVAYKALSNATGYERDDISEYLCGEYFGWRDKKVPGKRIVQVPVRTTTTNERGMRSVLSKVEFVDYVAFVQRFGAEHGIVIEDPEQMI
jgi:hypothetical protein